MPSQAAFLFIHYSCLWAGWMPPSSASPASFASEKPGAQASPPSPASFQENEQHQKGSPSSWPSAPVAAGGFLSPSPEQRWLTLET